MARASVASSAGDPLDVQKCLLCGWVGGDVPLECQRCGAGGLLYYVPQRERQGQGARPSVLKPIGADGGTFERLKARCALAQVVGGHYERPALVLVTGPRGAGKSTAAAELALELADQGERVVWLDAEMSAPRAAATFRRARRAVGGDPSRVLRGEPETWEEAAEAVGDAGVVVVDSLDEWAERAGGGELGRRAVLAEVRELAKGALVLVICQWARRGHLKGSTSADHRCDALVIVEQGRLWQDKCRWSPPAEAARSATPSGRSRAAGRRSR